MNAVTHQSADQSADQSASQPADREAVLRRVRKLLAIANDARGDMNECAAAARMAEAVMRRYQIEHFDLIEQELKQGDAFASADVGVTLDPEARSERAPGWAGTLAVQVAKLHGCQVRYVGTIKYGKTLRFSGYALDVELARQTYCFIVNTMRAGCADYAAEATWAPRSVLSSFRAGFVAGIAAAVNDVLAERQREAQASSTARALVVAKDRAVAAHFGEVHYTKSSGRSVYGEAFANGHAQGRRVAVERRAVAG